MLGVVEAGRSMLSDSFRLLGTTSTDARLGSAMAACTAPSVSGQASRLCMTATKPHNETAATSAALTARSAAMLTTGSFRTALR